MTDKLHFTIGGKAWSLTPFRCPADFDPFPAAEIVRGQLAAMPADAHAALHWKSYIGNPKAVEIADALCAAAAGPLPDGALLILMGERAAVAPGTMAIAR